MGEEDALAKQIQQLLRNGYPALVAETASLRHGPDALMTFLESTRPAIVFLDVEDLELALPVAGAVRKANRGTQIIAMSRGAAGSELLSLMRLGVRERLELPLEESAFHEAMARIQDDLEALDQHSPQRGDLIAFMPAKAGAGTSTVAMHAAHACAQALGRRVAMIDLDLNCGIQAFMAKKNPELSIYDIAQYSDRMDESLWERMVVRTGEVDLLPGGVRRPGARIESHSLNQILSFASQRYPCTFVDLSGNWERYSVDAMERATRIFLVTTTDFSALYHSRRDLDTFREMGVIDKVSVILNRTTFHTGLDKKTVDSILGVKPVVCLPNAYHALQEAMKDAATVKPGTPFGQGIEHLRATILPETQEPARGTLSEASRTSPPKRLRWMLTGMLGARTRDAKQECSAANG
jgi:pilus assembly protein CpaE